MALLADDGPFRVESGLTQVPAEELARHVEYSQPFGPPHLGSAAQVFAHLHLKWPRRLVEIGAIEEGVGQPVDQPERHLAPLALQRVVQHDALAVRHRGISETMHDQEWRSE